MQDTSNIKASFCILASSYMADDRIRVLKHGETFAVFDRYGDIQSILNLRTGLYHEGTRYLSKLEIFIDEARPFFLSSTVKDNNTMLAVDLTNTDILRNEETILERDTLHINRSKFIYDRTCYERIHIKNYSTKKIEASVSLRFDADFVDLFEVRGVKRKKRGDLIRPKVDKSKVVLTYHGLDKITRITSIEFSPEPASIKENEAVFPIKLESQEEINVEVKIICSLKNEKQSVFSYNEALGKSHEDLRASQENRCNVWTSNEQFNDWINRSYADLHMMITDTEHGEYPYAGVPWFNTAFGRDGIISALECLWIKPEVARGVLLYLSETQAKKLIPEQDAEPGKILHETRKGEMANLEEIPFGMYYGTIDATPLYVMLANKYLERTGDLDLIRKIWNSLRRAVEWIDTYGDKDKDGFIEYERKIESGLFNQGWKDSEDSVFYSDGSIAEPPIALCEVQGYVYAAKLAAANIAVELGEINLAEKYSRSAYTLQAKFEEEFWCGELGMYSIALDGKKRQCKVRSSNAGQCLFTGIVNPERAKYLATELFKDNFFSGWGIRTIPEGEVRYNPMSYHNGSIWPHDNALIAYGLSKYGFHEQACRILTAMFDASIFLDMHRLPELFCGFPKRPGEGPTLYPVACSPQTWSAVSVFLILQSCLGLTINGKSKKIIFHTPMLPESLSQVLIKDLRIQDSSIDIELTRHERDVGINVLRKKGDIEVAIIK